MWRRAALRRQGVTERDAFPRAAFLTTGALVVAFLLATGIPAVNHYALLLLMLTGPAEPEQRADRLLGHPGAKPV
jgi:hypothetical protein